MNINASISQIMHITDKGLDLIHLNEKLDFSIKKDLYDFDTSTIEGEIEFNGLTAGRNKSYIYKKLPVNKYFVQEFGMINNLYIGYDKDIEIVKSIVIVCSNNDTQKIKDALTKKFGIHEIEASTGIGDIEYPHLYAWTTALGYDVFFPAWERKLSFNVKILTPNSSSIRKNNKNKESPYYDSSALYTDFACMITCIEAFLQALLFAQVF